MGFFDNMKKAAVNAMTNFIDPAMIAELAPQAKGGIIQMMQDEETAQAAPVLAVLALNENKTDILLSLYKINATGEMEAYKDIDLTDTSALLKLITNGNTPTAPTQTAISNQPGTDTIAPGAAIQPGTDTIDTGANQ